ncbi:MULTISPECIES: hypothetical protein [unclassified Kitasatospora]|uniref:hypothetical protein n=1 Tax=unclassified Kitasatospora TaxID=2633591 RepID=UPI00070BCE86|nr:MULTISPECIES: hypothetical protein [unclassified Kitasatospora]KQV12433.1 hypothetical protein ASC99_34665 [Kitasatospora sp. Root107]KRB66934.1 hypothetical protein ASE03_30705 [Kitasatospora sp. Root187]
MTDLPYRARLSGEATALVRTVLTEDQCKQLQGALELAMADPWSWPASDREDLDDSIRQIVLPDLIAHYVILPDPPVPHLWVITLTVL